MGTSGAYGGTGGKPWRDVRDLFDDVASGGDDAGGDGGPEGGDDVADEEGSPPSGNLSAIASALAAALTADDLDLSAPPSVLPVGRLLPVRPRRGGGSGHGDRGGAPAGSVYGGSLVGGRSGQRSTRSVVRGAARGGVAIGSAYALRSGDRGALAEVGLDLDELRTLTPRAQCTRILEVVLGAAGHPDEAVLRVAAAAQLKAILMLETPPSEADALREFVVAYVFEMGVIELRAGLAIGSIDVLAAARAEKRIRRYIRARVLQLDVPSGGIMRIADISAHAARLVREAIEVLRAR